MRRMSDPDPSTRVMVADLVFNPGSDPAGWGENWINHPTRNPYVPDYQNIFYGDGHLEGHYGSRLYPQGLRWIDYSLAHSGWSGLFIGVNSACWPS